MRRLLFATAVALFCIPSPASSWGDAGHMTVAALAYDQLKPAVRARVDSLIRLHPLYATWTANASPEKAAKTAFVRAATWPDLIKDKKLGYINDGDSPSAPESGQNIGYADKLMHRYWHYVDVPFSNDGTPVEQPGAPNALTQIKVFAAALAAKDLSDDVKSYDLVWLLHLAGDVHQPLHATSRFSQGLPHGDGGGNAVTVCDKGKCNQKLHGFWDNVPGTHSDPKTAIKAASLLRAPDGDAANDRDPEHWVTHSSELAKSAVYVCPVGPGAGPYSMTSEYRAIAVSTTKSQVTLAAARLGNTLNTVLSSTAPTEPETEDPDEIAAELNGVQAQIDSLSRRDPRGPETKGVCSKWDCRRKCCSKVWGVLLCEPTCYSGCETHNFLCAPSQCEAVFAADPASATVISAFKMAVDRGGIKYNDECIALAEGNAEMASTVCSACGGGLFCTGGSTITEIEGKCACAELKLPDRPAPPPQPCDDKPCPTCRCKCKPPGVCHAECICGKCRCLPD